MKRLVLLLMALLLVPAAGCTLPAAPPATSTPSLVGTPQGLGLAETPQASTPTLKPTASATPAPTRVTATPIPTPDIGATVVAIQQPRVYASYPSPDGQWRAEVVIYDCIKTGQSGENAYEQLKLVQVADGAETIADDQPQRCGGLGAFGLGGLYWSPNSRHFYYTTGREGVPDGCGYWERPIMCLDVASLNKEYIGAGPRSPDGGKIATWKEHELVVWDIDDGPIARASAIAPGAEIGPIVWSPDSQSLAYVQVASWCSLSGKSYVVRLDLPEFQQTLLVESEKPTFGSVRWSVADELVLFDESGKEWRYDFAGRQLEPLP